jgi:hypothetical protein
MQMYRREIALLSNGSMFGPRFAPSARPRRESRWGENVQALESDFIPRVGLSLSTLTFRTTIQSHAS